MAEKGGGYIEGKRKGSERIKEAIEGSERKNRQYISEGGKGISSVEKVKQQIKA